MPLIIPPPRNLGREGLVAFATSLQQNRIREEERERQEEAADAGGGPLGAGIGMAAGFLLAPVTGGASLAAVLAAGAAGAAVGGGLGQVAGTLIDPPGAGFPGGQAGQITQGIGRAVSGFGPIIQQAETERREGVRAAELERGREFQLGLAEMGQTFRATEAGRAREAATLRPFGRTSSDVTAFLDSPAAAGLTGTPAQKRTKARLLLMNQAAQVQAARQQQVAIGQRFAKAETDAEIKKYQAWQKSPDGFIYSKADLAKQEELSGARSSIWNLSPDEIDEADHQQVKSRHRAAERRFVQTLRPKPPTPRSYEQLLGSGQRPVPGTQYSVANPQTGKPMGGVSFTDKGTPNFVRTGNLNDQIFELDAFPGTKFIYDRNMEPKQLKVELPETATGFDTGDIADLRKDIAKQEVPVLDSKGRPTGTSKPRTAEEVADATKAAVTNVQDTERFARRREMVIESEGVTELFGRIGGEDKKFVEALKVIMQSDRVRLPIVEEAAQYIFLTVGELIQGVDVPDTLNVELVREMARLRDIVKRRQNLPFGGQF